MRKLEIGSGNRPQEGFEHLDLDANCPHLEYVSPMDNIPVEDNTFDEISAVHVIEHQPWPQTIKTLKEWVRVLKPGGSIYIATPNLKFIARAYLSALENNPKEFLADYNIMLSEEQVRLQVNGKPSPAFWANFKIMSSTGEYDQHYACFDASMLSALLIQAGCSRIKVIHDSDSLVMRGWK